MYIEGYGVIKHYFPKIKNTKISIEEALDNLLVKKRRTELHVKRMNSLSSK